MTTIEPLSDELQDRCLTAGVNPSEVQIAVSRYRAYREFYVRSGGGEALPIEQWFHWYYTEVASETDRTTASPGGCSVDSDSRNRGLMANPDAFLAILSLAAQR